ncbi:MAG: hypothetical protein K2H45_09875 [Acetatifactor sp.]|nr:hypothetical protein [Acetatifactor sp.]
MAVRQRSILEILTLHGQRYPLMEPADYGKLLYQNEFGPEHMISSPESVLEWLAGEWAEAAHSASGMPTTSQAAMEQASQGEESCDTTNPADHIEDIGNHLYRFHLAGGYDLSVAAPLLARLFFLTAQQHQGTTEGLMEKLDLLQKHGQQPGFPSLEPWLTEYIQAGCPALHHSEVFRQAYTPHYRILRDEYAIYFPVIYQVERCLSQAEHVTIAIDGPCGSGKSSLAALLAELFPSRVLHMDDYYLPLQRRSPGWEETPCGNMDLERFLQEALLPAARGEAIACQPYSCQQGQLQESRMLPSAPLTIVEGSYSHHPLFAQHYDLKLFLRCSHEEQLARLQRRESTRLDAYLQRWIPLEEAYYQAFDIMSQCDLTFDNTLYFS